MPEGDPSAAVPPQACVSLDQARAQIDRVDRDLLTLLAERQAYVGAVARFKSPGGEVRDPARIEAMVKRARAEAAKVGLDPQMAEDVWRALAEASARFQERRAVAAARRSEE